MTEIYEIRTDIAIEKRLLQYYLMQLNYTKHVAMQELVHDLIEFY